MDNNIVSITNPPGIFIPQARKCKFPNKKVLPAEQEPFGGAEWNAIHAPSPVDYAFSNLSSYTSPKEISIDNNKKESLANLLSKLGSPVDRNSIDYFHIDHKTGVVSIGIRDKDSSRYIDIGQFPVKDMVIKARFFDPTNLKLSKNINELEFGEKASLCSLIKEHLKRHNIEVQPDEGAVMGFIDPASFGIPANKGFTIWKDQNCARKLGQALAHHATAV